MAQYLKISNRGSLNRKALELLGFGTKRGSIDDASVIGNKGSGSKLAPIGALRLGLDIAIASTDVFGTYLLHFELEDVHVDDVHTQEIIRVYENRTKSGGTVTREPSRIVLEAFQDWDKRIGSDDKSQFKVTRELLCNALDIDKEFTREVVDRIEHVPEGTTAVYLLYTWEIYHMLFDVEQRDRYFKFLSRNEPLFTVPGIGSIYQKSDPANSRLFGLGVLVDCVTNEQRASWFDYSLEKKSLVSEERIIKNIYEFMNELGRLFARLTDPQVMKNLLDAVVEGKATFEADVLKRMPHIAPALKELWLSVVYEQFGSKKIAIASGVTTLDEDCQQLYGFEIVARSNQHLASFLRMLGIPDAKDALPDFWQFDIVPPSSLDAASRKRLTEAFRLYAKYFPDRAHLPIVLYYPRSKKMQLWAGFTPQIDSSTREDIWLAAKTPTSLGSTYDIFQTLVHESRHRIEGVDDYDRAFLNQADLDIAHIVFRAEGKTVFDDGTPIPCAKSAVPPSPRFLMRHEVMHPVTGDPIPEDDEVDIDIEDLSE